MRGMVLLAARLASFLAIAQAPRVPAGQAITAGARAQLGVTRSYDPSYVRLSYPGGDVPSDRGVCSDVVVRALRAAGVDLQREVHEDMRAHFRSYPRNWGLARPDANIDHRRVPNLERYFTRAGKALPASTRAADFQPGDIVAWRLDNGLAHIGIVSDRPALSGNGRLLVIHNIGRGAREEDVLFDWAQTGHYRWAGGAP